MAVEQLITNHIDLWTSTLKKKSATGRGTNKKIELYGIKKLRELILELAVRGKLVPQDLTDEPASELLKRIEVEKDQLIKDKKIKKPKKLSEVAEDDKSFELPMQWGWVRLNDIGEWGAGSTPKRSNLDYYGGSIPWFKSGELNSNYISTSEESITEKALKETSVRYNKVGDVLVAMYGATIGKTAILSVAATTNQAVCACTPFNGILNTYLLVLLKGYKSRLIGMGAGGAQPNISREKIISTVAAIPPYKEQQRIVDKVDELMALCDQLESQTVASLEAHETLTQVLLTTLTDSITAEELNQNWLRVSEYFETLFTTEQSVDQLKQTILQLAVMGKIVPQNPNDEPASVLLEKIAEEKAQLIKDKIIKKQKSLPPISDEEKPFELPSGWSCAYMQDLCSLITDGTHQTPKYVDEGKPFVSAQCVKPFKFMLDKCRYVSEEHYQGYIKNRKPNKGDVLLARVGAGIGEAALIDTDIEFAIYVSTGLLKPFNTAISSDFLVIWLNSPIGRHYSEVNTLGKGVSQGNLNLSLIRQFVVELPPITEQHRIVAKVDEFMALCEQLKTNINDAQTTQLNLTDAIVDSSI